MNKKVFTTIFLTFLFCAVTVISQTLEDKVNDIAGELLCPVCQGQSVAESNSALAQDMRSTIREKLREGQSKEQIIEYFRASYGDTILGSPPLKGINIFLWLLPVLSLSIGAVFIFHILKSYKKPQESKTDPGNSNKIYIDKVEEELNKSEEI